MLAAGGGGEALRLAAPSERLAEHVKGGADLFHLARGRYGRERPWSRRP
jgi:hypothetical protein